jgi:hypothetical protein
MSLYVLLWSQWPPKIGLSWYVLIIFSISFSSVINWGARVTIRILYVYIFFFIIINSLLDSAPRGYIFKVYGNFLNFYLLKVSLSDFII